LATCLELARFLEMPPASVVVAAIEKSIRRGIVFPE
jgi:hypothetical protein